VENPDEGGFGAESGTNCTKAPLPFRFQKKHLHIIE